MYSSTTDSQPQQQQGQVQQPQGAIVTATEVPANDGRPVQILANGYRFASTPQLLYGISGKPRSVPHFHPTLNKAENDIRAPRVCCCTWAPGPNIPAQWYDGQAGWITYYYSDIQPFDRAQKFPGHHKCEVQGCDREFKNSSCCDCCPAFCWCVASEQTAMARHLQVDHGISPPPKRRWATDLFDTEGCMDVICCAPCQGSRQIRALTGYGNDFSWLWCCLLCWAGIRSTRSGSGREILYWIPPHCLAALLTRFDVIQLQNIDEGYCKAGCTIAFCSICSLAQTYRELSVAGVWPGGVFNEAPPQCAMMEQQPLMH